MDNDLVERAQAGDVDAFTELVRRYQAMVFGSAMASLAHLHNAEDVTQQTFLTAWRGISRLQDPERFGGWLRGIVRFECSHHIRKRRAPEAPLDLAERIADGRPDQQNLVERQESLDRVLDVLDVLPDNEREVSVLFYVIDLSQRDVAAYLDLPITTVNNRLRSARQRLRTGDHIIMQDNELRNLANDRTRADRIGQIVRTSGPLVEIQTDKGRRPNVLDIVQVGDRSGGQTTFARITHQGPGGTDHGVIMSPTDPGSTTVEQGTPVLATGNETSIPLNHQAIATLIELLQQDARQPAILETGIKLIDLFCPLLAGGLVGIVGDMQAGKMVLVEELVHRLDTGDTPITVLVFVQTGDETSIIRTTEYRRSSSVAAVYLPVEDATRTALEPVVASLDTVLVMSKSLAGQGRYPAIDPLRSSSQTDHGASVPAHQAEVASAARAVLEGEPSAARSSLEAFLTQPFFVAEPFTGRPGETVTREAAVDALEDLLRTAT